MIYSFQSRAKTQHGTSYLEQNKLYSSQNQGRIQSSDPRASPLTITVWPVLVWCKVTGCPAETRKPVTHGMFSRFIQGGSVLRIPSALSKAMRIPPFPSEMFPLL